MDTLWQDVLFTVRSLRRSPGYAGAVIATLTLGVSALTSITTVINAVLFQPLPLRDPGRVVQIWTGSGDRIHGPVSPANFLDLRQAAPSFESIAAEDFAWFNLAPDAERGAPAERMRAALVSSAFFTTVGVVPALGRGFGPADDTESARVAILGHAVFRRRFGGDPRILDRRVVMNGQSYQIIGVMPAGFEFPGPLVGEPVDLWVPLAWAPGAADRGIRSLGMTARLKRGVSPEEAQVELDVIARRLADAYPETNERLAIRLVGLQEELVGGSRRLLGVLFGAVLLVLLIACANVTNLSLIRAQRREQEVLVRAALGAGRGRIARLLLTESVLLGLVAGALGVVLAVWLTQALVALAPAGLPRLREISVQGRVVGFSLLISTLAGLAIGAAPLLGGALARPGELLRSFGRGGTARAERVRLRSGIVVLEIAVSLVLLIGAGLLLRSFERLTSVSPGFDADDVLAARVVLPTELYDTPDKQARFAASAVERLRLIPGVEAVAAVDYVPFGGSGARLTVTVEGRDVPSRTDEASASISSVTGEYFSALHIPVSIGRPFDAGDRQGSLSVAAISETMARNYWPGLPLELVVGRRVRLGGASDTAEVWRTIVGIVGDVKHWSLAEAASAHLYFPIAQAPAGTLNLVMRAASSPALHDEAVRQALQSLDRDIPVTLQPLRDLLGASVAPSRIRGLLLAIFAGVALLLAIVGIYGVISYLVTQRSREIGIRIALGADTGDIVALVLRRGGALTAAGVGLGLVAALWLTRLLHGLLYEVERIDPLVFLAASSILVATAMAANYLPARKAAGIHPTIALQAE